MDHLVSIIIPVYNGEKHLVECLNSVFEQTYPTIEVIVVNNGSTDDTTNILENIEDNRLTVINTENKGACHARNLGFESSKGDYIQFLDADDFISLNKIERQLNILEGISENVSICDTVIVDENSNSLGALPNQHSWLNSSDDVLGFLIKLYKHYGMIQTNVWLTPRSVIIKAGKWNEELKQDQDGEFFCRVVLASAGVKYADNCYNYYRKVQGDSSISNNKSLDYAKSTLTALDLKTKFLLEQESNEAIKKTMAMHYKILAVRNFGIYSALYKEALYKCKQLGGSSHVPVLGGKTLEYLKTLLGWRLAKRIALLKQMF